MVKHGLEKNVAVTIDPQEHQSYAWATVEDIAAGKFLMATPAQGNLILESLRAANENEVDR